MPDFKVWEDVEPPKGTVYKCSLRAIHERYTVFYRLAALPEIAVQICPKAKIAARPQSGEAVGQVAVWVMGWTGRMHPLIRVVRQAGRKIQPVADRRRKGEYDG